MMTACPRPAPTTYTVSRTLPCAGTSALIQLSQALRDARSDLVELETFVAGHTLSWNTNPDRWQATVTSRFGACVSG